MSGRWGCRPDLGTALDAEPGARGRFGARPPGRRAERVRAAESAKAEATRARPVAAVLAAVRSG
jgi:uncharacterized protein YdeI (YjbR/CyaY-like superfamily)